jgi:hypothetical protein
MLNILMIIISLAISSWDSWVGNDILFLFPIFSIYLKFFKDEELDLIFTLIYVLFFFSTRYDLGFTAILFFVIYIIFRKIFNNVPNNYYGVILYSLPYSIFLSYITYSYSSFITTNIVIIAFYFLNMRLIFNER